MDDAVLRRTAPCEHRECCRDTRRGWDSVALDRDEGGDFEELLGLTETGSGFSSSALGGAAGQVWTGLTDKLLGYADAS